MTERARMESLLAALDASPLALRRDACGDWAINGKQGRVYADGAGFLIVVVTDGSARRWGFVKKRLNFCQVTQDADDEGALRLDRVPVAREAGLIREAVGIRRRRHLAPETLASMAERLRRPVGKPLRPQAFAKNRREVA